MLPFAKAHGLAARSAVDRPCKLPIAVQKRGPDLAQHAAAG